MRKYERGDIPKLEWLDRLTFKEIEKVHAVRLPPLALVRAPRALTDLALLSLLCAQAEAAKSPHLFLYIDMLQFDFPIIFAEPVSWPLAPPSCRPS